MDLFFPYENLTWPEVAALPRTTALVIPFGTGYDSGALARRLEDPERMALLPAIPFGWPGSALKLPTPVLEAYVRNLLNSLREDGFTRVYVLVNNDVPRLLAAESIITLPTRLPEPPAPLLPPETELGKVILLPIGHTEQHGLHLPLCVDSLIIDAIAKGTAAADPELSFCMPLMPYGVSTHRPSFAGTLSAGGRAFEDFWIAAVDALVNRGFDRFYLMSGHGGNTSFLVNVAKYAGERHRRIFCATAFLHTSGALGAAALLKYRTSQLGGMGHACELETSFMLHLRPDLCHMERVVDETDYVATPDYYMDWIEGGALIANPPWDDDTKTGAYGAGSHGTAKKGRLWLAAAIEEKLGHVREIHEQHRRREARRNSGYGLWGRTRT
jgi:creatinine amidohydrolase